VCSPLLEGWTRRLKLHGGSTADQEREAIFLNIFNNSLNVFLVQLILTSSNPTPTLPEPWDTHKHWLLHQKNVSHPSIPGCQDCVRSPEGRFALKFCAACHNARYCNRVCQAQHWPVHIFICNQCSITSADHLVRHCLDTQFPGDIDDSVAQDFKFLNFCKPLDRHALLGLYEDVTLSLTVSATMLYGCQINEGLAEGIIQHCTQLSTR
jgi:hypothetical protein